MSRRRGREIHYKIPQNCYSVRMASVRLTENLLRRQTVRRHVGKATTRKVSILVIVSLGRRADLEIQVVLHRKLLVPRPCEVVAETARTSHPCNLRCNRLGASDSGDIRARTRKLRCELRCFLSIVRLTRSSNSCIRQCQFQLYQMTPKQ